MTSADTLTRNPVSWWKDGAVGAVGGALVALSLPPFGWWPLAWLGLAVVAASLPGRAWRSRVAIGAGFGLADYIIGLLWVQEFSVPGYIAVVVISTLYAVLAVALVPTGRRAAIAVALPCTFVLADWARDRFPLGGLPLAGLALGQASGPLAPALRIGGGLGLVAATVLAGVAIAELGRLLLAARRWPAAGSQAAGLAGVGRRRPGSQAVGLAGVGRRRPGSQAVGLARFGRRSPRSPAIGLAALSVAAAAVLPIAGTLSPSGVGGHLPPLRVGLVQGGGPRGTRAINTDPQVVFDRALAASASLSGPLDLILWPEGMLQSHSPFQNSPDAQELAGLAAAHDATLLAGVEQDVGTTRYLNEVVAWDSQGRIVGRYVKHHLVPFGEYVPFRSVIQSLFNVKDVPLDAIPGRTAGFVRTPAAPLAVMISYEVFFDERARGGVRAGGQVLVVPTNTASYRSTQVPTQEVAADRMRAWETGRWLVQATPTGYTTVVSPTGQVLRKSHLDASTVIQATVPRRTGMTVYDHIGDLTVVILALIGWLAVAVPAALRHRRGARQPSGPEGSVEKNNARSVSA